MLIEGIKEKIKQEIKNINNCCGTDELMNKIMAGRLNSLKWVLQIISQDKNN